MSLSSWWCCLSHPLHLCFLCQDQVQEDWQSGENRKECSKENKGAVVAIRSENENTKYSKCCEKLREFSVSKSSMFVCDSGSSDCTAGDNHLSQGDRRSSLDKENIETCKVQGSDDDDDRNSTDAFRADDDDDIPLIDENPSLELEDVSMIVEKIKINRPKFLQGNIEAGFYCNPLSVDSPDIFKLRAPLVSCENILTPGISSELLRAKQI